MPLAPLPPSNTKRYYIGMQGPDATHHIQVRVSDTVSDGAALVDLNYIATVLQPVTFSDYVFHELLVSEKGSDIRNPVQGWTNVIGGDALSQPVNDHPLSLTTRARSSTGRKCRATIWGQVFARDEDWLYTPPIGGQHLLFLSTIAASPTYFLTIDGSKPVWRQDYTIQFNDHWVKQERP